MKIGLTHKGSKVVLEQTYKANRPSWHWDKLLFMLILWKKRSIFITVHNICMYRRLQGHLSWASRLQMHNVVKIYFSTVFATQLHSSTFWIFYEVSKLFKLERYILWFHLSTPKYLLSRRIMLEQWTFSWKLTLCCCWYTYYLIET